MNRVIDKLEYDFSTYSIDKFIRHIEQRLGYEIKVQDCELGDICGMWLTDKSNCIEYIMVNEILHGHLYEVTVLHELAHIILPHETMDIDNMLANWSDDKHIIMCRKRQNFNLLHEEEAEYFAHIILGRSQSPTLETHFGYK